MAGKKVGGIVGMLVGAAAVVALAGGAQAANGENRQAIIEGLALGLFGVAPVEREVPRYDRHGRHDRYEREVRREREVSRATDVALVDLERLVSEVRRTHRGSESYEGLEYQWDRIRRNDPSWRRNAFGGRIEVAERGRYGEFFSVTYTNVPREACIDMALARPQRGNPMKMIDGVRGPFSEASAYRLCGHGSSITWVFE